MKPEIILEKVFELLKTAPTKAELEKMNIFFPVELHQRWSGIHS